MYYKPNTSFLKLHVYLIRQDPALEQIMDKKESSHGFKKIPKPHPDKYLQTERTFSLRADMETAEIQPKELTFRYNSLNFYEVFIENPGRQFHLTLLHSNDGDPVDGPVWICKIQKDDHPLSGHTEVPSCSEKYSGDEHLSAQGGKASCKSDRKRHFGMSKDLEVKDPKQLKELPRVREAGARMPKALTVQTDREKLFGMLEDLKQEELEKFKWFLRDRDVLVEFQPIPESKLEKTSTCNLVDLMFGAYTQHTVEVTKMVFTKMNRNDLVKKLSDTSS
ncbi:uncharacterized protein LOC106456036 [Pundamilia nyererei]|uniref:Uncharacterized protein LOC106456036 n=1 Tax=Pundamilia nyererei TaxID=303518 RepID=A0A9Y6J8R5_9CICH|nr:PREDICTED: uncharacterized protein LOC106456036 [Pundamilia nyererei]